ncbi:MAG: S-methyl-5-thioribose-1-phosphate isomerase [Gammaproteobacteria bacterium]|nr:S-methyl-5-thioribose-1-phosphate isomerase [Gammaproteobacteria bacterium]MBT3859732.1 S-methyl-5-thioribose-1-phosphate isomerase [Gammaproteobacteria bacterium]MBT3987253.1 S-methyl-5-thioribose-1-phosphate isomerase [Gammaproteobacteria bacterium]MBT4256639.1 S-methyl-5-thioribose-1-phosphate isomerase [Gammaproteobacteria bacterium]MBT4582257.1 S-methyl-5-thioribose-1-phosphate isomerase [Gammaproteobacteria bacterium]
MKLNGRHEQSIWFDNDLQCVKIIDQTRLPHDFEILDLHTLEQSCVAISSMQVRGAPLIGVTAAYGIYLAMRENPSRLTEAYEALLSTRPTAINLKWALDRALAVLEEIEEAGRADAALQLAREMEQEDIAICESIGENGAELLQQLWDSKQDKSGYLNVLTHCNAGALATVDWGTALSVVYKAVEKGIPIHVWVDETRPRNQGAALTCWELAEHGINHTLIVDNAGGHLMQHGQVDCCVVGSDRTTLNGDVCNKIGTYLKALAAFDNEIPFYAALPVSTIDFSISDGLKEIPIEERETEEVTHIEGKDAQGRLHTVQLTGDGHKISNFGFDVTPARLISAIITEKAVVHANAEEISTLRV